MRENGADLNNEMLRHRYVVNTAVSSAQGLKFNEICGGKKRLAFKSEAFCCRWRHFPISSVFREKINFWKHLGAVQSSLRLLCKKKRKGNQRLEATSRKFKRANDSKSISAPIRQVSFVLKIRFRRRFLALSVDCAFIIFVLETTLAWVLGHQISLTITLRDTCHSDCHNWYLGKGGQNVELSKDHSISQKKK